MVEQVSDTDAAVASVVRQLAALDALGPDWSEPDQVRFVRAFVEQGIDDLARAEDAHFGFLVECVMQASENMQDARIHVLEEQIDDAAEGEGSDFLLNLGFMLGLELLVVSAATYAIPALVVMAAARMQARRARQLVTVFHHRHSLVAQHRMQADALADFARRVEQSRAAAQAATPSPESHWTQFTAHRRALRQTRQLEQEYAVAVAALERGESLVARADAAVEKAASGVAARPSSPAVAQWQDKTLAHVAMHRVAENVASELTDRVLKVAADAPRGSRDVFRTDTLVGAFLGQIRRDREAAAQDWSATRLHVRCLPDPDFLDSAVAQELFLRIHAGHATGQVQTTLVEDRAALVRGMEGALWLAWLRHLRALDAKAVSGLGLQQDPLSPPPRKGRIHQTLFVTSVREGQQKRPMAAPQGVDPRSYAGLTFDTAPFVADGVVYPGIGKLRDEYADYLYREYARPFFVRNPDRCPAPLSFDAARYDDVAAMPEQWGPVDQDRRDRLAEMKMLVIVFFRLLESDPSLIGGPDPVGDEARTALRTLLGLSSDTDVVAQFAGLLPPVSEPDDDDLGLLDPAAAGSSPDPAALERDARDAATLLGQLITDLDLAISQHPVTSYDDTPEGRAAQASADAHAEEIRRQQDAVVAQYVRVRELAADLPALLAEITARYDDRINALTAWPDPAWTWYGPEQPQP